MASGPVYHTFEIKNNSVIIYFEYAGEGLAMKDYDQLRGFTIASDKGNFMPAEASIRGTNSVVIHHPEIKVPAAVRYMWGEDITPGNLINSSGLPASPFRTDTIGDDTLEEALWSGSL